MKLVATGSCTRKWLKSSQTIRNLTSGDLGIPIVVIQLGVTALEKARSYISKDLFDGMGKKGHCDLV